MTDMTSNGLPYWGRDLVRRVEKLEDYEPAVMQAEVRALREEFRAFKLAFYTFAFSVVGGAVLFAITAFKVVG